MGKSFDQNGLTEVKDVYVLRMLNVNGEKGHDVELGVYLTHEEARHDGLTLRRLEGNIWPEFEVKRESGCLGEPHFLRRFIEALVWNMSNLASYREQVLATRFESPEDEEDFMKCAEEAKRQIEDIRELISEISAAFKIDIEFPPVESIAIFDNVCDNLKITFNHAE